MRKIVRNRSCREIRLDVERAKEEAEKYFAISFPMLQTGEDGWWETYLEYDKRLKKLLFLMSEQEDAGCLRKK